MGVCCLARLLQLRRQCGLSNCRCVWSEMYSEESQRLYYAERGTPQTSWDPPQHFRFQDWTLGVLPHRLAPRVKFPFHAVFPANGMQKHGSTGETLAAHADLKPRRSEPQEQSADWVIGGPKTSVTPGGLCSWTDFQPEPLQTAARTASTSRHQRRYLRRCTTSRGRTGEVPGSDRWHF